MDKGSLSGPHIWSLQCKTLPIALQSAIDTPKSFLVCILSYFLPQKDYFPSTYTLPPSSSLKPFISSCIFCPFSTIVRLMVYSIIWLKFNLESVKMMDLASDPESIRFLTGNRISLPLLKHEIDRRMLKITCLVKRLDRKKRNSHHRSSTAILQHTMVQTDELKVDVKEEREGGSVLGVIHEQEQMNRRQIPSYLKSHRREQCRPSANKTSKPTHLKSDSKRMEQQADRPIRASLQRSLVEEHPLIESNGFTFRDIEQTHEGSTDRKFIQDSQDDKIFESLDFGLQISNVEMCNSITSEGELPPCRTSLASRQPRSDTQMVSAFTDLSGSELGREGNRRPRKIRMAGREVVLPEPQRRIIVGEECRQRMEREVEQLFGQRRKEVCDYKLRINVLKKIEEKYGEEYCA